MTPAAATPAGQPAPDRRPTSFKVRIWSIKTIRGRRGNTYQVRWIVAGQEHSENFADSGLADARRSELRTAASRGEAFDVETGLPVSELRAAEPEPEPEPEPLRTWLEHARDYADLKWWPAAPKTRAGIADALATVTPALLTAPVPDRHAEVLREALYQWLFRTGTRTESRGPHRPRRDLDPPEHLAAVLAWLAEHTVPLAELAKPEQARAALDRLARKLDGRPAAATTVARKRAVFFSCLDYAVERGDLAANPLVGLKWTAPKQAEQVDRRVVCNHRQARTLLAAAGRQGTTGRRLAAFFAVIYYAGCRPGEVAALTEAMLTLPTADAPDQWGQLDLAASRPAVADTWVDEDEEGQPRQLKHRALGDTRPVPLCPPLVAILRDHLAEFGTAADGRLFPGVRGGDLSDSVYSRVWKTARQAALTPAQAASPLAGRPYDLRHACLSGWLNAGVSPQQVAAWAGHSLAVLLHVYAKCVDGDDVTARKRIEAALTLDAA